MMGRSGKSSHYQLSTNKLISRIHVRATYFLAEPPSPARVEIICNGWNGLKIHCQGKAWDLMKDDSFTSYSQDADIMVDVQDARVLLQWPKAPRKLNTPSDTDSTPSENSPRPLHGAVIHRSPFSSPLRQRVRLESPVSPSPAVQESLGSPSLELLGASQGLVQVYEDEEPDDDINLPSTQPTQSTQHLSQPLGANLELPQSDTQEFSDQDEENDPIIQSFGPFGENLLPRMESFNSTTSPANPRRQAQPSGSPPRSFDSTAPPHESQGLDDASVNPLTNHVVNQLAYSRLSSTPLSTIMNNLPAELTHHVPVPHPSSPQLPTPSSARAQPATRHEALTMDALKALIDDTPCIGEVPRAGKDAAGKPLESEYYYVPERDFDATRREAVVEGLRKPGLRNCRKQHKVSISFSPFFLLYHIVLPLHYVLRCGRMKLFSFPSVRPWKYVLTCSKQYFWRKPK